MDGITTKRGMICFMTTNHIEELDDAFIRPGRVDMSIKFDYPDQTIILEALKVLAPGYSREHNEFLKKYPDISIAWLQKHLFECHMEERKSIL